MELVSLQGQSRLNSAIKQELSKYDGYVITPENEAEARKKRAELNKFRTSVDSDRKLIAKELKNIFDEEITLIDERLKDFDEGLEAIENERKEKVYSEITDHYLTLDLNIDYEKIHEDKWLNKTTDWKVELERKVEGIKRDLEIIPTLNKPKLLEIYLQSFNLSQALEFLKLDEAADQIEKEIIEQNYSRIKLKNPTIEQLKRIERFLTAIGVEFTYE